jgi:SAM-dependent methyltransferase
MSGIGYDKAFHIHLKKDFIVKLNLIKRLVPQGSKILEIGAGPGYFANILNQAGYQVTAVEITEGAQDYAKENNINIEILSEDISLPTCSIYSCKYDLVISWAVIEHVKNPLEFINLMKRYCKKNGFISVDTGIVIDFLSLIDVGYSGWLCPPSHLHVFSKKSLQYLIEKNFQVIKYYPHWGISYQNKVSVKIFIYYLKRIFYSLINLNKTFIKKNEGKYNMKGLIIGKNNK